MASENASSDLFATLPDEVWFSISLFFDVPCWKSMRAVNSKWHQRLMNAEFLWDHWLKNWFHLSIPPSLLLSSTETNITKLIHFLWIWKHSPTLSLQNFKTESKLDQPSSGFAYFTFTFCDALVLAIAGGVTTDYSEVEQIRYFDITNIRDRPLQNCSKNQSMVEEQQLHSDELEVFEVGNLPDIFYSTFQMQAVQHNEHIIVAESFNFLKLYPSTSFPTDFTLGRFPIPFSHYHMFSYNNELFFMGGEDLLTNTLLHQLLHKTDGNSFVTVDTFGDDIPAPRKCHTGCVIDHNYYIFGGWGEEELQFFNDLYCLHLPSMKWTRIHLQGDFISPRCQCTLTPLSERFLLVVGGAFRNKTSSKVYGDIVQECEDIFLIDLQLRLSLKCAVKLPIDSSLHGVIKVKQEGNRMRLLKFGGMHNQKGSRLPFFQNGVYSFEIELP